MNVEATGKSRRTPKSTLRAGSLCLLAIITAAAAILRANQADESLWLDELHTAWAAAAPADEVAVRARMGNQSPWFYYLTHTAVCGLGMNEIVLRLPSLVAGTALIPLLYLLVFRWTRSTIAAACTAIIAAIDHDFLFYAGEARPYALVQLVGLLQVFSFWRVLRQSEAAWRAVWILLTIAMFYLHYTAVLLVVGELVYAVLLQVTKRTKYKPWELVCDLAVVALAALVAASHLSEIALRRHNWSLIAIDSSPQRLLTLFPLKVYVILPLVGLLIAYGLLWLRGYKRAVGRIEPKVVGLLVCSFTIPLVLAWLSTVTGLARLFMVRYLVVTAALPMVLLGILLAVCQGNKTRFVLAALIVAAAVGDSGIIGQYCRDGRFIGDRNQDWRSAAGLIRDADQRSPWPVFVRSGLLEADRLRSDRDPLLRDYCLLPITTIYRLDAEPRELIPLPTTAPGRLGEKELSRLRVHGGAWFIINGNRASQQLAERNVSASAARAGMNGAFAIRKRFGDVLVLRLDVR